MRRGRIFFLLAFVLIVGLVAVFLVWRFLLPGQNEQASQSTPTPVPIEVLYLTQNVSKGTRLDDTMFSPIPWPQDSITPAMFRAEQDTELIGRVVKYDLEAGMPLLGTMLLGENEQIPTSGSPWALNIPSGMVAVSIPINRLTNISYAPRPGDHVNVIASLMFVDVDTDFQTAFPNFSGIALSSGPPDPESGDPIPLTIQAQSLVASGATDENTGLNSPPGQASPGIYGKVVIDPVLGQAVYLVPGEAQQRPRFVTHMLLQDVVVLQVGDFPLSGTDIIQSTAVPEEEPVEEDTGEPAPIEAAPATITLIVRPQDAVALNYLLVAQGSMAAQLSLVLRGANDNSRENTLPVTLQFLLEQYQIPVPARLPYSLNPRIDKLAPLYPIAEPTPVEQ